MERRYIVFIDDLIHPTLRVLFVFPQALQKASFLRDFGKTNNPADAGFILALRREGDSNPRCPLGAHTLSRRAN